MIVITFLQQLSALLSSIEMMLLLGHRGTCSNSSVQENTFAGFDLALSQGCNGIEFDVRRTKCGSAVICHDAHVGPVKICDCMRDDLPALPTLQEVLQRYRSRAFLDIEIKVEGVASEVLLALSEYPPERGYLVSSFGSSVLSELRARSPQVPLGFIFKSEHGIGLWRDLPVQYAIPHKTVLTEDLVREVHERGGNVIVWTVNDRASMQRFAKWGVDGIISDETALLGEVCQGS